MTYRERQGQGCVSQGQIGKEAETGECVTVTDRERGRDRGVPQ